MSIFEGYMTLRARYYKMKIHLSGAGFSSNSGKCCNRRTWSDFKIQGYVMRAFMRVTGAFFIISMEIPELFSPNMLIFR